MAEEITELQATPVLDYAIRGSVEGILPDVDALLDRGTAPQVLRRYFDGTRPTLRYYAQWLSRRYSSASLRDECAGCGAPAAPYAIQARWKATMDLEALELGVGGCAEEPALTLHPLCAGCADRWRVEASRHRRVGLVPLIFAMVCFLLALIGWPLIKIGLHLLEGDRVRVIGALAWMGAAMLGIAAVRRLCRRPWLPPGVRTRIPGSVIFICLGECFERVGQRLVHVGQRQRPMRAETISQAKSSV